MLLLRRGASTQARLASCVPQKCQEQFTLRDAQRITLYSDGTWALVYFSFLDVIYIDVFDCCM